ncbi:hypothetical protein ARSEF4850_006788 [Beauveria asiatica]
MKAELRDLRTAYMTNLRALAQQQIDWDIERSGLQEGVEAERARLEQNSLRHKIQDNEQKIKALIEAKKYAEGTATKLRGEKETMQHSAPNHESRQILSSEVVEIVWQTFFAAEPQSPGSADATVLDRLHCGKTDQAGRFSATEENPSSESPVISSGWHDEVGRKVQEWRYFDSMMLSDGDFMPVEGNKDDAEGHGANTGR